MEQRRLSLPGGSPPPPHSACVHSGDYVCVYVMEGWILPRDNKKGAGHGSPLNYSVLINYHSLLFLYLEDTFSFQGRDEEMAYDHEP